MISLGTVRSYTTHHVIKVRKTSYFKKSSSLYTGSTELPPSTYTASSNLLIKHLKMYQEQRELQCFNPGLYATLADIDDIPHQCIAPTARRTRCAWRVSDEDIAQANSLRANAELLPRGPERERLLARFTLLHCCNEQHRWRLEDDRSGCLGQLVRDYGSQICFSPPMRSLPPAAQAPPRYAPPPPVIEYRDRVVFVEKGRRGLFSILFCCWADTEFGNTNQGYENVN